VADADRSARRGLRYDFEPFLRLGLNRGFGRGPQLQYDRLLARRQSRELNEDTVRELKSVVVPDPVIEIGLPEDRGPVRVLRPVPGHCELGGDFDVLLERQLGARQHTHRYFRGLKALGRGGCRPTGMGCRCDRGLAALNGSVRTQRLVRARPTIASPCPSGRR
jgi:hypothetical protein